MTSDAPDIVRLWAPRANHQARLRYTTRSHEKEARAPSRHKAHPRECIILQWILTGPIHHK